MNSDALFETWRQLGAEIRAARRARKPRMSQARLGKLVGLTQGGISRIEKGETTTTETLSAIAAALGLELEAHLGGVQLESGPPSPSQQLMSVASNIDASELEAMLALVQAIPNMPTDLKTPLLQQFLFYGSQFGASLSNRARA